MGRTRNKTRQTLTPVSIQKPVKDGIQLRDGLFVSLENGYIIPATPSTVIEGCCVNDIFNHEETKEPEDGSHRACIYFPKRHWESFTIEVENGEITQEDVGQTFLIIGDLQHINYETKAELGGQFRLERVITPTKGEFTYYFESALSPQGPKGKDGETPTFTFKPVVTLPVGSEAGMDVEQDGNNYELTFKIPQGANGKSGDDGTPGGKGNPGDTIDIKIGTVADGTNASATITPAGKLVRDLNLVIPKGKDGEDGLTPTPKHEWSPAREYQYIDIVRHPDTDGVGSSWIRTNKDRPATSADEPGESPYWMLLVKDGADGEPGPEGGTVVIPVEGRPGKDGTPGDKGTPGKDGISPHDEGEWNSREEYTKLSMVRADTGEEDCRGNKIYGYYVTNTGVHPGDLEPKDNNSWQLVAKDGNANNGNIRTVMVGLKTGVSQSASFNEGTLAPKSFNFDCYTGNPEMASSSGIIIKKTGHYRLFGHTIILANTQGKKYINLARYSALLAGSRTGSGAYLATSKQGGPYASSDAQGPWFDLDFDIQLDLYEGDIILPAVRLQTDTDEAYSSGTGYWKVIGGDDVSGQAASGNIGGIPTFLGCQWISKITWQKDASNKIRSDL